MNFHDLNRILRSEIFLHKDGQLRAVHILLGFEPISKHFQSPKNVIRAKDRRLTLIDVAVSGFLLTDPSSAGTQDAQLSALGRTRMCLILQETLFQDQVLKPCKSI